MEDINPEYNPNPDPSLYTELTPILDQRFQELGLSESQLRNYDINQLEHSIRRLDRLVQQPEEFNLGLPQKFQVHSPENMGRVKIIKPVEIKSFIGSLILDKKQNAIDSLLEKKSEKFKQKENKIPTDSEEIEDREQNINEIVQTFQQQVKSLIDNEKDIVNAKILLERDNKALDNRLKTLEKKSQLKLAFIELFLARESAASILGSVAFISIFVIITYSIFDDNIQIPDIINNTFLIILGYFFGQSSKNNNSNTEKENID